MKRHSIRGNNLISAGAIDWSRWLWLSVAVLVALTVLIALSRTQLILSLTTLRWLLTVPMVLWAPVLMQIATAALVLASRRWRKDWGWWLYAIACGVILIGVLNPASYWYWRAQFVLTDLLLATAIYLLTTHSYNKNIFWWITCALNVLYAVTLFAIPLRYNAIQLASIAAIATSLFALVTTPRIIKN